MRWRAHGVTVLASAAFLVLLNSCDDAPVGPSGVVHLSPKDAQARVGVTVVYGASVTGVPSPAFRFSSSDTAVAQVTEQTSTTARVLTIGEGTVWIVARLNGSSKADSATLVVRNP